MNLFLAGDGVSLLQPEVVSSLEVKGTGRLQSHLEAINSNGARLYLSGMSAKARGLDGRQPPTMQLQPLLRKGFPVEWERQREEFI